jgi:hypothetical protein
VGQCGDQYVGEDERLRNIFFGVSMMKNIFGLGVSRRKKYILD